MNLIGQFILSIYGVFIGACIIILIFLIIRRNRIRKTEDFEDRKN